MGGLDVGGEVRTDTIRARDVNGTTSVSKLAVTGSLTVGGASVQGGSPFFCAGRVDGAATAISSVGRVGYTVSRPSGFPTGVYRIQFDSPAPSNDYVISLHVVTSNQTFTLTNWPFHFSVLT